ncbi:MULTISPECIES: C40 family peptidase [Lactobacillus]|uniref:NlpC/P60 family protein n=1 Tax=Lactobacillus xujianguonis TaxID=2495899 RepID=A0A437SVR5_9LACO|nr:MULTISPECIES: C40 family peptidase [Lactobacillus]RVU70927.1 NlpC/P60 family protein [Lactobacillus xujianguonis]RVU73559.1 NlpC/P60 family protein [Lactobacillus xujianguonis]
MSFKRNLVKFAAVLLVFLTGVSAINIPTTNNTVQAAENDSKDDKRDAIVKLAKKQVGKGYVYGATGPSAFDCSGLVQYVYKNAADTTLPRTTYAQVNVGKSVSMKKLKKGDLLFWGSASAPYHVGIYVGNNQYVHAATPGQGVIKQTLSGYFYPSAAKRVL